MSIAYHVYSSGADQIDVDYTVPIATVTGLSYLPPPLSAGLARRFAVRAFDASTQLEEANTQAVVQIAIDGQGNDLAGVPAQPTALQLYSTSSGGCRLVWMYMPVCGSGLPEGFHVSVTPQGGTVAPTALGDVSYSPGQVAYSFNPSVAIPFAAYTVSVASYNAAGSSTAAVATGVSSGGSSAPFQLDSLQFQVFSRANVSLR